MIISFGLPALILGVLAWDQWRGKTTQISLVTGVHPVQIKTNWPIVTKGLFSAVANPKNFIKIVFNPPNFAFYKNQSGDNKLLSSKWTNFNSYRLSVSQNGSRVAWDSGYSIVVTDVDTGKTTDIIISNGLVCRSIALSPNGREIAFSAADISHQTITNYVGIVDLQTGQAQLWPAEGAVRSVGWSENALEIFAFTAQFANTAAQTQPQTTSHGITKRAVSLLVFDLPNKSYRKMSLPPDSAYSMPISMTVSGEKVIMADADAMLHEIFWNAGHPSVRSIKTDALMLSDITSLLSDGKHIWTNGYDGNYYSYLLAFNLHKMTVTVFKNNSAIRAIAKDTENGQIIWFTPNHAWRLPPENPTTGFPATVSAERYSLRNFANVRQVETNLSGNTVAYVAALPHNAHRLHILKSLKTPDKNSSSPAANENRQTEKIVARQEPEQSAVTLQLEARRREIMAMAEIYKEEDLVPKLFMRAQLKSPSDQIIAYAAAKWLDELAQLGDKKSEVAILDLAQIANPDSIGEDPAQGNNSPTSADPDGKLFSLGLPALFFLFFAMGWPILGLLSLSLGILGMAFPSPHQPMSGQNLTSLPQNKAVAAGDENWEENRIGELPPKDGRLQAQKKFGLGWAFGLPLPWPRPRSSFSKA